MAREARQRVITWDWRRWRIPLLLTSVLTVAAAIMHMASPPLDTAGAGRECAEAIDLTDRLQVRLSCDSYTFLRGAVDPSLLLVPYYGPPTWFTFQFRPLPMALAAVVGPVLQPVVQFAIPADRMFDGRVPMRQFAGVYSAFMLQNVLSLFIAAVLLFELLVPRDNDRIAWLAFLSMLAWVVWSGMVKAWIFSALTSVWASIVPVIAVAVGYFTLVAKQAPSNGRVLAICLTAGVAALAHSTTVIIAMVACLTTLLKRMQTAPGTVGASQFFYFAIVGGASFFAPTLAWIGFSYAVSGGYWDHAMQHYKLFQWLPRAIVEGGTRGALAAMSEKAGLVVTEMAREHGAVALILLVLGGAIARRRDVLHRLAARWQPLLVAILLVLGLDHLIWYLSGNIIWARVAPLTPVLALFGAITAAELDRADRGRPRWSAAFLAASAAIGVWTMLFRAGPYQ